MDIDRKMNNGIWEKSNKYYPLLSEADLKNNAKIFQRELIAALHNQESSLPTILNPIHKMQPQPGFGVAVEGKNRFWSSEGRKEIKRA